MDVSDNSGVSEVDECVIYKSAINRAGVKDGEVSVFNARRVEVRMGKGASMQSHAVDRVSLLATSLDRHSVSNRDVLDILSYLGLPLLVAEEQLVMGRVGVVVEHPVVTRVVSILFCLCTGIDNTKLRRGGDKEHWSFISRALAVRINKIDEGRDPCKVNNLVVVLETAWGFV
jgi:hypothetical protein